MVPQINIVFLVVSTPVWIHVPSDDIRTCFIIGTAQSRFGLCSWETATWKEQQWQNWGTVAADVWIVWTNWWYQKWWGYDQKRQHSAMVWASGTWLNRTPEIFFPTRWAQEGLQRFGWKSDHWTFQSLACLPHPWRQLVVLINTDPTSVVATAILSRQLNPLALQPTWCWLSPGFTSMSLATILSEILSFLTTWLGRVGVKHDQKGHRNHSKALKRDCRGGPQRFFSDGEPIWAAGLQGLLWLSWWPLQSRGQGSPRRWPSSWHLRALVWSELLIGPKVSRNWWPPTGQLENKNC